MPVVVWGHAPQCPAIVEFNSSIDFLNGGHSGPHDGGQRPHAPSGYGSELGKLQKPKFELKH